MLRRVLIAVAVLVVFTPPARAGSLTVLSNNVENLPKPEWADCKGDHTGLLGYMAGRPPDVFLVQQIRDLPRLQKYVEEISAATGVPYAGTIAIEEPAPQKTPCKPKVLKNQQTNAIIWREDLLTPIESSAAESIGRCRDTPPKVSKTLCYPSYYFQGPSAGCRVNQQARSTNAVLRLRHDDGNTFTFATVHWPSGKAGEPNQERYPKGRNKCAQRNARAAKAAVSKNADTLRIFGGDMNISDDKAWWAYTGRLGFIDVVGPGAPTVGSKRIDFLFAQRGDGSQPTVSSADTIDYDEARGASGLDYSQHRALVATFSY